MEEIKEFKKKGRPLSSLNKKPALRPTFKQRYQNPEFKEKQQQRLKQLFHCNICNLDLTFVNKSRHYRSQSHIKNKVEHDIILANINILQDIKDINNQNDIN